MGRMQKIDLVIARPSYLPDKIVQVEIVDVAPHLASVLTFGIGPHPDDARVWRIHNLETGRTVSECDRTTKSACVAAARHTLKRITLEIARCQLAQIARQLPQAQGETMVTPLEQFALAVLEETRLDLGSLDGGWHQDTAEELGLLVRVPVTESCGDECRCDDFPMDCLRYSNDIKEKIDSTHS